jgi:hypothetical protein
MVERDEVQKLLFRPHGKDFYIGITSRLPAFMDEETHALRSSFGSAPLLLFSGRLSHPVHHFSPTISPFPPPRRFVPPLSPSSTPQISLRQFSSRFAWREHTKLGGIKRKKFGILWVRGRDVGIHGVAWARRLEMRKKQSVPERDGRSMRREKIGREKEDCVGTREIHSFLPPCLYNDSHC